MIESLNNNNNNNNNKSTSGISDALSEITKIKENNSSSTLFKTRKQLNKEKNNEKEMNKQIPRESIRLKKK